MWDKPSAGTFRLSCPLLVKACDELEREGMIAHLNKRLEDEPSFRAQLNEANVGSAAARRTMVSDEDVERLRGRLGSERTFHLMRSGIAGISPGKTHDVKCMHAQLADRLCRGPGSNKVGDAVIEIIEEQKQLNVCGQGHACATACGGAVAAGLRIDSDQEAFSYRPRKNKQKLFTARERRREARVRAARTRTPAA